MTVLDLDLDNLHALTAAHHDHEPVVVHTFSNAVVVGRVTSVNARLVIVRGASPIPHPIRLDDVRSVERVG